MTAARKRVGILVWDGVELLDFAGPGEVFAVAENHFEVVTVGFSPDPVVSQGFLTIKPQFGLADCPRLDVLVIPGGETESPRADDRVLEFVRSHAHEAEVVLSVCTGALVLAAAGLLEGRTVTTWHGAAASLQALVPSARLALDQRWVDEGGIVTTAGVTAGIDGALHVVARLCGEELAQRVARYIEHSPGQVTT